MAIGLEMVEQQFQVALDNYINKVESDDAVAERTLRETTEWDVRWPAPFEM